MANPDPNAFTAPFMLTKGLHRDVYPAVDPKNPHLSATGKVVIITGASGGLGHHIALAWSNAGAKGIVLVGRNNAMLEQTAQGLKSKSLIMNGNITSVVDTASMFKKTIDEFGKVDVLINAAGTTHRGLSGEIDPEAWWSDYESNVKGTYNMAHHFIKATGANGTIINLVSIGASFLAPEMSSYSPAKLAEIKLGECLDLEHPNLHVFSVHPGIVEAENNRGSVIDVFTPFAKDKGALTGGLSLYLAQPRAEFLSGGFISANWDVQELEKHKAEIVEKKLIKLAFLNGQLNVGGYPWSQ